MDDPHDTPPGIPEGQASAPLDGRADGQPPRRRRRRRAKKRASRPDDEQGASEVAPATPPESVPPREKKARRSRPAPEGERPSPARLGRDVVAALDALVSALAEEQGYRARFAEGGRADATSIDDLVVMLAARPHGRDATDARERAEALVERLRDRVAEAIRGATAFHQGHVYCFFTDTPESPYSHPPTPTDVFAGYHPNGKPSWLGFANLCIARREPRVDRLYGESPEVIAVTQRADELTAGLLPSFGRGSLAWRLHGQVACGLVPRDLDLKSRTAERIALTLQVIETRQRTAGHRLQLNMIGITPLEVAEIAAASSPGSVAESFRRLIRATREKVEQLGRRSAVAARRGEAFDLSAHVDQLLLRLRSDLLRVFRSRDHRTRHAEERHQSGERPTALALTDALGAGDGRMLRDEAKDTVVVLGPKRRVHVFSRIGRHVTSLELEPNDIARRIDLGRWRPLERHAAEIFKLTLKAQLDGPS